MILHVDASVRNDMLQVLADALNAGAGPATIKLYTGTMPATPGTAITSQTLLATLTCSDPCEDSISAGVLTFDTITQDSSADATGTATWARILDSDGNAVMDCDVGATGSGAVLEMNTVAVESGGTVAVTSLTITLA